MAKHIVTQITDDLDGSKDAQPYSFAWQGTEYTIDLNNKNFKAMEKQMRPYVEAGTKVSRRSPRRVTGTARTDATAVREWAKGQGLAVSERGRIPKSVAQQYDAAH